MLRLPLKGKAPKAMLTAVCCMTMLLATKLTIAQNLVAPIPSPVAASPATTWASLTTAQKTALAPLHSTWESLSDGHQRKWLALSQNFGNMSLIDKEKLHSRMGEWASLKPKERQQARLNFAETKKTPPAERAANWDAYQALSPEEKQALARKANTKPAGAAIATKPPAPQKLTPVPLTRNTPETQREKLVIQQPVNHNTLLPLPPGAKPKPANAN